MMELQGAVSREILCERENVSVERERFAAMLGDGSERVGGAS